MYWLPDVALPGHGVCVTNSYSWPVGASYVAAIALDLTAVALAAHKLMKIRHVARSSFWSILLDDGISWCFLTLAPTTAAILCFYLGKTIPAQSTALVISSTMHALLACRAYRKLSDFADTLPASFCPKDKVANGTMLDPDILARLAWMSGGASGDDMAGESPMEIIRDDAAAAQGGKGSLLGHLCNFIASPRRPMSRRSSSSSGFSKLLWGSTSPTQAKGQLAPKGSVASTVELSRPDSLTSHFNNANHTPLSIVTGDRRPDTVMSCTQSPGLGLAGVQIITHSAIQEEEIDQGALDTGLSRPFGSRLLQHSQNRIDQRRPETSRGVADLERHHRHHLSFTSLQHLAHTHSQEGHVSEGHIECPSPRSVSSSMYKF